MKCEWVQENILLHIYNELADDARYELEQHLGRCPECAAELKSARAFHATLSKLPVQELSPNLLASARMRLQEKLETAPQGGWWQRLTFDPANWLRQMRFSPALAAAIFIIGFGGGIGAMYKLKPSPTDLGSIQNIQSAQVPQEASITGIRSVVQEPGSNQVTIKFDTVHTEEAQGSLNDQRIQQLLLFAARNNYSSGVRMDSVDLLTQKPDDTRVREALIYSLRYDTNPGVRLKAIEGLGSYVKDDTRVRDAVLNALMTDNNPGVRTQALLLLQPVKADGSVRAALQHLAETDQNQYIRSQARTVLAQLPEID
jgi:HEAT repeat protein/putative zinc finger protein